VKVFQRKQGVTSNRAPLDPTQPAQDQKERAYKPHQKYNWCEDANGRQRWSRIFAQGAKWNFCLTAGTIRARESGDTMKKRARRNHSPVFKAKVALAAIKGDRTLAQLSEQFDVHANQITDWKDQLVEFAAEAFERGSSGKPSAPAVDVKTLHAKIGELTLENDFLEAALGKAGLPSAKR
jgi:transposase